MWLKSFRLENYSSFKNTKWIDLQPGMNLFIGQNNSGKSALLKALVHPLPDNPHRAPDAYQKGDLKTPKVELRIETTVREIFARAKLSGMQPIFPAQSPRLGSNGLLDYILREPDQPITIEGFRTPGQSTQPLDGCSIAQLRDRPQHASCNVAHQDDDKFIVLSNNGNPDNLTRVVDNVECETSFFFSAERLSIAKYGFATEKRLHHNASNLPAVLAYLQGSRRPLYDKIEQQVIDIMPGVSRITVTPEGTNFEILIWPVRDTDRRELAFSLEDSGTGVAQLIAILTAVAISDQATIIIDEINTFLHPTAAKELMGLLNTEYAHHQYIISTHSSDIISSSNPSVTYLVEREKYSSNVKYVDLTDLANTRKIANLLGFSMMDVFGYNRIVWVEGPTEELCFPYLANAAGISIPDGLGFSSVASTDAFSNRGSSQKSVISLYDHAAKKLSPLLQGMAFSLDREELSNEAVKKLERSKRKLRFLGRRCTECYCLHPEAISIVLSKLDKQNHSVDEISAILNRGGELEFRAKSKWNGDIQHVEWLQHVDAPKLLKHVFGELTQHRQEFRKTRDTIEILKTIHEIDPDFLSELNKHIALIIDTALRDTAP